MRRAPPHELADHPCILDVDEAAILCKLESRIDSAADPSWLNSEQTNDPPTVPRRAGMVAQLADRDRRVAKQIDEPTGLLPAGTGGFAYAEIMHIRLPIGVALTLEEIMGRDRRQPKNLFRE